MRGAALPPGPPARGQPVPHGGRQREGVAARQRARNPGLGPAQQPPPPDIGQVIVRTALLQSGCVAQRVVGPPQPAGDPIRHKAVDGVVAAGDQQHDHPGHGEH